MAHSTQRRYSTPGSDRRLLARGSTGNPQHAAIGSDSRGLHLSVRLADSLGVSPMIGRWLTLACVAGILYIALFADIAQPATTGSYTVQEAPRG